jgi:ribonuclease HI
LENKPLNNKQMKKQTAIEWLEERMPTVFKNLTINKHLFEQAKEMEKEQIIKAYWSAYKEGQYSGDKTADEYYNETYKSEQ